MKCGLRNQTAEQWLNNGDFEVVCLSYIYIHYPIVFHSFI